MCLTGWSTRLPPARWVLVVAALTAAGCFAPSRRTYFAPCATDDECESGMCRQAICTQACTTAQQCGVNSACVQAYCVPKPPPTTLFSDDFSDPTLPKWTAYGQPAPVWTAAFTGREGVFDNNGDGTNTSGALSKDAIDCPEGCTIEADVYAGFSNLGGCWSVPTIGLSDSAYPRGQGWADTAVGEAGGVSFRLTAEGDKCWATPASFRRHAWFMIVFATEGGGSAGSELIDADPFANRWTRLAIEIGIDRRVRFLADNTVVWAPTQKLHPNVLSGRNLVLGQRSSGSAGKSYHDSVRVWK